MMKNGIINRPYIFLLESINGKYFYDTNLNDIVSISENAYRYLRKVIRGEEEQCDLEVEHEINQLKSHGYLSDHRVNRINHPVSDYLEGYLKRRVQKITLQVTQNCNLRCSYCVYSDLNNEQQRSHSNKRMDFDTAKKAVDFLAKHSIDCDEVNISFYGGEPLLEFRLIQQVITYAKGVFKGKNVTFNMTSNCTLLNDEIVSYLVKEKVQLMVSIDGPEKIHDSCRRFSADGSGSFQSVMEKLNRIAEEYPEYMKLIHVSMVINPQNQFDCINSVFVDYDIINNMNVHTSIVDDIYSLEKVSYSEDFIQGRSYQIFLAFLSYLGKINHKNISPLAHEEIQQIEQLKSELGSGNVLADCTAPGGPCIPGQLRLFVDVSGNFFPCERVNENSPIMNIGNLEMGFDFEKAMALLNVGSISSKECKDCWAFQHCYLCAKYADDDGRFSKEFKISHCDSVRQGIMNSLKDVVMLQEIESLYL